MSKNYSEPAKEILRLARNELLVNFRFLDRALFHLEPRESEDVSILTDGLHLYYDPWFICRCFREQSNSVARSLLHLMLHLLLRHSYGCKNKEPQLWSLSCDIAVEAVINDSNRSFLNCGNSEEQALFLSELKTRAGGELPLLPDLIYPVLQKMDLSQTQLEELALLFWGDSHALWYEDENARYSMDLDAPIAWEKISKRMQVELELTGQKDHGLLISQLRQVNRVRQDYDSLLRRFARPSEVLKISQDEFDYTYYSYGLQLYGDIPIVEPLEYRMDHHIRDFVLVLDCSGSIDSALAEKFLSHTYTLLSREDRFDRETRLHILQCDDRIRDDTLIRNKQELEQYFQTMTIYGRGETDFRPVFTYTEDLCSRGELTDLRGLIYFTDGEGTFPSSPPRYDTAFVIHRKKGQEPVPVPGWAILVELEDEEILNGKFHA